MCLQHCFRKVLIDDTNNLSDISYTRVLVIRYWKMHGYQNKIVMEMTVTYFQQLYYFKQSGKAI